MLTLQNLGNAVLTGAPRDVVERPADNLSSSPTALTPRQHDVLSLIVQGKTNKEIARSLGLGEGTVKIHVAAIFGKLGVNRRAAVAVAGSRFFSPDALKSA